MTNLDVKKFNTINQKVDVDSEGYLKDLTQWNEVIAIFIAKQQNLVLTSEHWEIIYFVRSFYLEYNTLPSMRILVNMMNDKFGEKKGNSCYLYYLFPEGLAKLITKISGLPRPGKCL